MQNIAVSIYCTTYNHVGIIRKCLDGFVMQKAKFKYEAWIHDDRSTDGTIEVLREYEEKYPEVIHVVYEEKNQYSQGNNIRKIMNPYLTGKYIAVCEGDDYWTDPYKLQKQFDFMEKHQDVALCAHGAIELNLETGNSWLRPPIPKENSYISMEDIIRYGGGYFPTCSTFFRNDFEIIRNKWGSGLCGDFNSFIQAGLNGKVYFLRDNMAVKTVFYPGSWSSLHKDVELMKRHKKNAIDSIRCFDRDTNYKYHSAVEERVGLYLYQLECELNGKYKLLFTDEEFKKIYRSLSKKKKIRSFLLAYFKFAYDYYQIAKSLKWRLKK